MQTNQAKGQVKLPTANHWASLRNPAKPRTPFLPVASHKASWRRRVKIQRGAKEIRIILSNGFDVAFKLAGKQIRGIGAVKFMGRPLRNGDFTLAPALQSIDGLIFRNFRLIRIVPAKGKVRIHTEVIPEAAAELEWQDGFNHEFVAVPQPDSRAAKAEFVWEVGECAQTVGGKTVPGFYYAFTLKSRSEFHSIIEQGTWEIDRLARPVTVIAQRAGSLPYESRIGKRDRLYTHESIDLGAEQNSLIQIREGLTTPNETIVWQMMPRGSGSQTFDFQATNDGWLAIFNPVPRYVQACIRKERGSPALCHLERHYFPRRRGVDSGRKVVLACFPEGGLTPEQMRDDWSDVFDTVNDLWRSHFGYPEDSPDTAYSPTFWNGVLSEEPQAYRRVLDMIPKLASFGVKRLYTGIWWKSHFTEDIGDKSICHILEFVKAEKFGGNALLKEICATAHRHGIKVFVWCIGAISRSSPLHKGHPDWICMDRNGHPSVALGHPFLYAMDYNTGWADCMAKQILAIKKECGIDGIFIDSYHNLNFQPINYNDPQLRTNMPGLIAWQRRMRAAGLEIMIETNGIFGTSLNWLDRGHLKTECMAGQEHAFYKSMVCIKTPWIENGRIDESFCYRATANNAPIRTETDMSNPREVVFPAAVWQQCLARINHDYQAVRDRMIRRRTLPQDRGVEWMDSRRRRVLAIWSFADFDYQAPEGFQLHDVTADKPVTVERGIAPMKRFHTYRVDPVCSG